LTSFRYLSYSFFLQSAQRYLDLLMGDLLVSWIILISSGVRGFPQTAQTFSDNSYQYHYYG